MSELRNLALTLTAESSPEATWQDVAIIAIIAAVAVFIIWMFLRD